MPDFKTYASGPYKDRTMLWGGETVKHASIVDAYGTIDELNSFVGEARERAGQPHVKELLKEIQENLFAMGAELAAAQRKDCITGAHIVMLEKNINDYNRTLPPLRRFILPYGSPAATSLHVARTVCRRAERRLLLVRQEKPLNENLLKYLNRLSDLLFVLARYENKHAGVQDEEWEGLK